VKVVFFAYSCVFYSFLAVHSSHAFGQGCTDWSEESVRGSELISPLGVFVLTLCTCERVLSVGSGFQFLSVSRD
jgi:hypothetical protein